jgi:aspartyl protease family protein
MTPVSQNQRNQYNMLLMSTKLPPQEHQQRIGKIMIYAMWLVLLGLLALFFNMILDQQHNPNQALSEKVDGNGIREVVLERNRSGHYVASGLINDQPVVFLVDTGASDISIPDGLARRLGLKRGRQLTYQTAKGPATVYSTVLSGVSLGPISLKDVRASINPNVDGDEILLGMSFLKHIEFSQQGRTLTLRQR